MNPPRFVLATKNAKKVVEMKAALAGLGLELVALDAVCPTAPTAIENGSRFEENATIKARHYAALAGLPCIADDSGLEVDALGGEPGVLSSSYAGKEGDDAANNAKLLRELTGRGPAERGAQFRCVIVVAGADAEVVFRSEGVVRGVILERPSGDGGFGYDPLFWYPEFGRTFAEIPIERKNGVSHRGRALAELSRALPTILGKTEPHRKS